MIIFEIKILQSSNGHCTNITAHICSAEGLENTPFKFLNLLQHARAMARAPIHAMALEFVIASQDLLAVPVTNASQDIMAQCVPWVSL